MVSIAVSFVVMIVAVSVSSGFRFAIRDGISEMMGDIGILPAYRGVEGEESPVSLSPETMRAMTGYPGVASLRPIAQRSGIVRCGDVIQGVLIRGTEAYSSSDTAALGVTIPRRLADITGLGEGDEMLTYFIGEKVKVRKFTVRHVRDGGMLALDENIVVEARLEDIRRVCGWEEGQCSSYEAVLSPSARGRQDDISAALGTMLLASPVEEEQSLMTVTARGRYPQVFDWLDLLDFNVLFILLLMTLVAGFNMISGLLILLFRNISTIGLLKTLGMTGRAIAGVFLRASSTLVFKAMAIGNGVAVLLCLLQQWTHLLRLNPENYIVSYVPVHLDIPMILTADALAYLGIMLLLLIPCLFISRVDPARTVKAE
jgi:lipoprotein-releasing system permease protein